MGFLDSVKNALKGVVTAPPPAVAPEPLRPTSEPTSEPTYEPGAEQGTEPEEGTVPEPPAPTFTTYTIRTGDTLGDIGRRHGVTRDELARINGIDEPDLILPGQELRVPTR